jgi:preprotein translocase subunit SecA
VEYQREGFDMFAAMMDGIKEESVGYLFNLEVQVEAEPEEELEVEEGSALSQAAAAGNVAPTINARGLDQPKAPTGLAYSAPSESGDAEVRGSAAAAAADDIFVGVSRNADCPCGSGKKYKKCHGAPGGPTGLTTRVNG